MSSLNETRNQRLVDDLIISAAQGFGLRSVEDIARELLEKLNAAPTALLSSPGRVPETFQGVTLAHQGASSGAEPRAIPSDAELQAPLKWDVIAGIKAGMPIDDVVLQRLCNMAQDRACQLEGSYPNHRTEQSRAREAATRAEGSPCCGRSDCNGECQDDSLGGDFTQEG